MDQRFRRIKKNTVSLSAVNSASRMTTKANDYETHSLHRYLRSRHERARRTLEKEGLESYRL